MSQERSDQAMAAIDVLYQRAHDGDQPTAEEWQAAHDELGAALEERLADPKRGRRLTDAEFLELMERCEAEEAAELEANRLGVRILKHGFMTPGGPHENAR